MIIEIIHQGLHIIITGVIVNGGLDPCWAIEEGSTGC